MAEPTTNTKRVGSSQVGVGIHIGLRMAGVHDTEGFMHAAKLHQLEQKQTGIAKKVLQAVPFDVALSIKDVVTTMRESGQKPDHHIVAGCLNTLSSIGLLKEPKPGEFIRVLITSSSSKAAHAKLTNGGDPTATKEPDTDCTSPAVKSLADIKTLSLNRGTVDSAIDFKLAEAKDPIDRLGALATRAREMAAELVEMASELESIAIDAEDRLKESLANLAKTEEDFVSEIAGKAAEEARREFRTRFAK